MTRASTDGRAALVAKPRRRWLQVSLRTLLILVTVLCIGLGWIVNRGERQRRAVAALREIGGVVSYDAPGLPPPGKSFDLSRWLPRDYFDDVYFVWSNGSKVTDADLVHLRALPRLGVVALGGTQVTDAGLAQLQELTSLEYLDLRGTQVTDAGAAKLQSALPNCSIEHE